MRVTLNLTDEASDRLQAEADRRGLSAEAVVAELVSALPNDSQKPGERRRLGFIALGSSTDGRSAADFDSETTMPRSTTDIIRDAEALADLLQSDDVDPQTRLPTSPASSSALVAAVSLRSRPIAAERGPVPRQR